MTPVSIFASARAAAEAAAIVDHRSMCQIAFELIT
jgi:hypothetical protein